MYITDKRKPHTVPFGSLKRGDVFAMDDEDDCTNKFYLMKIEGEQKAALLGDRNGDGYRVGEVWEFSDDDEVEPLRADVSVW